MAKYTYKAIDLATAKEKKGALEANSREQALQMIKDMRMTPMSVSEQSALNKEININIGQAVKARDLAIFCRQFNSILSAGVSVLQALDLLSEQNDNKVLKEAIKTVHNSVEKGEALAVAMGKVPKVFPSLLINMIAAGELSGSLEVALERMSEHFEKDAKLKQTVKKATTYPIILCIIALVVVTVLIVMVIPRFTSMFAELGSELPGSTRALIAISDFVKEKWWLLGLIIIGVIVGLKMYGKTDNGANKFGAIALKAPLLGNVNTKTVAARFSRTMSTLLASGVPLLDSLDIVSKVVGNKLVERKLIDTREQVSRGVALNKPLKDMKVFPPMVVHMVRIGEESGSLEQMLTKVADFYDDEVEVAVSQMTTMLEPAIIIFLAITVGFVIISILQPMFGMYEGINNY